MFAFKTSPALGADGADGAARSKGASGHQSSPRRHLSWPGGPQRMTAPGWNDQQVWSCVRGLQKIAAGDLNPGPSEVPSSAPL
ncbi:hypothetical protein THAOC_24216, partial [Thalassiosira oceanica]